MRSAAPTLRCPDDRRPLRVDGESAVPFAVCDHCSGLWFEHHAIERRDDVRAQIPESSARWDRRTRQISVRFCPACGETLGTAMIDGIKIDRCLACRGVWLEPGQYDVVRIRLKQAPEVPNPTRQPHLVHELSGVAHIVAEVVVTLLTAW